MRGLTLLSLLLSFLFTQAQAEPMPLEHNPLCTLQAVLDHMGYTLDPSKSVPPVYLGSQIPLKQFQDAVESQWGFRPNAVLNVYVADRNEIYLLDDAEYYRKVNRFVDDSLAHEFAHYVQVMYKNASLNGNSDYLETEAVQVQTWFRETFMKPGLSPCKL